MERVETFLVWAGRIATNKTLRFIRKDSRELLVKEEENDFIFEKASDDKEEFLPEDIMVNKEKKSKIRDVINDLSAEQKITIQYYYFAEMSVGEIAEAMQCSTGTVKSRLNYARKNIKAVVLDTEKREGIKLHSLSGLPLFALLFREEVAYAAVPSEISSSVVKGIADVTGLKASKIGKRSIKKFLQKALKTTGGKVVSGLVVTQAPSPPPTATPVPISNTLFVTPNRIIDHVDYDYRYRANIRLEDKEFSYLIDGMYLILRDNSGLEGVYTIKGKEILPIEFDRIYYDENTGGLFHARKDSKEAYFDKFGRMISDKMHYEVSDVIDGMFWCYDRDIEKYKIFSVDGNHISNDDFYHIGEMINGLTVVRNDDYKYGLLRNDGELVLDYKYDNIYLGDGEYIAINENVETTVHRLTVLDNSGNLIHTKDYIGGLRGFDSGFYSGIAELGGWHHCAIKTDGTILSDSIGGDYYNEALVYNFDLYPNGFFSHYNYSKRNQEIGLFNLEAKKIADATYLGIEYINNGFIIEDNDTGKDRFIDDKGNVIIPEYDKIQAYYKGKYFICYDDNGYDLYKDEGTILYNDACSIDSIGSQMFLCDKAGEKFIVNGQDGMSFMLLPEESITSNYSDGYTIKLTKLQDAAEGEQDYKYEIIDKKGDVKYKIDTPGDYYFDYHNVIVLSESLYSYMYDGNCYIKTW